MRRSTRPFALLGLVIGIVLAVVLRFVILPGDDAVAVSGRLMVLEQGGFPDNIITQIDFATDAHTTLFEAPIGTRVSDFSLAPNGREIVMALAIAGRDRVPPYEDNGLYRLPLAAPDDATPVVTTDETGVFLLNPLWSPDDALYYLRYAVETVDDRAVVRSNLLRTDLTGAVISAVIENAASARLAPDGSRIAYITVNSETLEQHLHINNIDGTDEHTLFTGDLMTDIDLPLFSPDGAWVYFSLARDDILASNTHFAANVPGVRTAKIHPGHILASNWWRVPTSGGEAETLTDNEFMGTIIYGDFDDNGEVLYFATINGLYAMRADGSGLTQLVAGTQFSTVVWRPAA